MKEATLLCYFVNLLSEITGNPLLKLNDPLLFFGLFARGVGFRDGCRVHLRVKNATHILKLDKFLRWLLSVLISPEHRQRSEKATVREQQIRPRVGFRVRLRNPIINFTFPTASAAMLDAAAVTHLNAIFIINKLTAERRGGIYRLESEENQK